MRAEIGRRPTGSARSWEARRLAMYRQRDRGRYPRYT